MYVTADPILWAASTSDKYLVSIDTISKRDAFMDLRQLRYFVAIAERHSFSAAAEALHVAQSALSRHVAMLEEELGGPLFERQTRGVSLTAAGDLLMQRARLILSQVQDARSELLAHHGELRGTVRLAAPSSLSQHLYVPLVDHFLQTYPKVELQLSEGTTQAVLSRLTDGSLDAGIVTNPQANKHMEFEFLMDEPIVLVGRKGDKLLGAREIRPQVLASLPLMMATGVDRILGKWGHGLKTVVRVDSTSPMKALVLAGRGYALMPLCTMHGEPPGGALVASVVRGLTMTRMLATHRGRPAGRAAMAVLKQLRIEVTRVVHTPLPGAASVVPSRRAGPRPWQPP
jgi:LysR family nitrogen assimilation transcriptional regulator